MSERSRKKAEAEASLQASGYTSRIRDAVSRFVDDLPIDERVEEAGDCGSFWDQIEVCRIGRSDHEHQVGGRSGGS